MKLFKKREIKLCKDCKWQSTSNNYTCVRPIKYFNLTIGEHISLLNERTTIERDHIFTGCGKKAKYFEPKESNTSGKK